MSPKRKSAADAAKASPKKPVDYRKKAGSAIASWILYILLAVLIIAYAIVGNVLIGLAAFIVIIGIFYYEIKYSVKTEGTKKSVIDIASAIGFAIVVWIVLIFALHTTAPIDAVSSCSMLPVLHRGDLIVLSGITNMSGFLKTKDVPVVNVSQAAFANMESNMPSEFLSYFAYFNGNKSRISYVFDNNTSYAIGLYNTACLSQYSYAQKTSAYSKCYVPMASQASDLIRYNYSIGKVSLSGIHDIVYTSQVAIGNTVVTENYSNPIIVYKTTSRDYFTGSIIHRLVAVMNVSGSYYFLTKGDNNQALDIEFENYPASSQDVLGYVVADIPLAGYVKLILSGQLSVPAGCNQTIIR